MISQSRMLGGCSLPAFSLPHALPLRPCTGPHSLHTCPLPVRHPAATQVASRLFILWGVVDLVPATRSSPLVLLRLPLGGGAAAGGSGALQLSLVTLLTAWCCSEVIRYSFFAFKVGIVGPGWPQGFEFCFNS